MILIRKTMITKIESTIVFIYPFNETMVTFKYIVLLYDVPIWVQD